MAQFKLRMPVPLREAVEESARRSGHSLNSEIVQRLDRSIHQERVLGSPEMAALGFAMTAAFTLNTAGRDWASDLAAYASGASGVIRELLRRVPAGSDRNLAKQMIISTLLTALAQDEEGAAATKPSQEDAA